MRARHLIILAAVVIAISFVSQAQATRLPDTVDDWLDPAFSYRKGQVVTFLRNKSDEDSIISVPEDSPDKNWGRVHKPWSSVDHQLLTYIRSVSGSNKKQLAVAELGCGRGDLAVLAVLTGARVDAIELPTRAKLTNENMLRSLQSIFVLSPKEASQYYKVHASSMLSKEEPSWTKTPHDMIYCFNVVHYFTETQLRFLAKRVFNNLLPEGTFAVTADAPVWSKSILDYYKSRQGKVPCPGMGIYSMKNSGRLKTESHVIPYDPEKYPLRPGDLKAGIFQEDGTVDPQDGWSHYYYSFYLLEELAAIFTEVGFKVMRQYYLRDGGERIEDVTKLSAPSVVKSCIFFIKQ